MERLDPLYIPLNDFNLVEASAGTGKTYTLTALYLRLVAEAAIPVNRILVVTYTNAATKELRDRIEALRRGGVFTTESAAKLLATLNEVLA